MTKRRDKSPYAKYHKRPYHYSELTRKCAAACIEGRVDDYDKLAFSAVLRQLLAAARAGFRVWDWDGLEWTRNDDRFRAEYAERPRVRGPRRYPQAGYLATA